MGAVGAVGCAAVVIWAGALSAVDLRERRLPNLLTLGGAAVILAGSLICGRGPSALAGAAVLGGLYLVVYLANPAGLGGGDVKLAVALGAVAGTAAVLRRRGASGSSSVVPHGPSMCVASLVAAALEVF
jgi:leader peptidase (prepilin peptidase)/N-methyltransferase